MRLPPIAKRLLNQTFSKRLPGVNTAFAESTFVRNLASLLWGDEELRARRSMASIRGTYEHVQNHKFGVAFNKVDS